MPLQPPSDFLGIQVTGDLGGVTYVQRAGFRRTSYIKTYPSKTPTVPQVIQRLKFRAAVRAYQALDEPHKQALKEIERRFELAVTGYNAFISCYMNKRLVWIEEWARQIDFKW
jgi:hypothetical protein